jgi:hypothetical protein
VPAIASAVRGAEAKYPLPAPTQTH